MPGPGSKTSIARHALARCRPFLTADVSTLDVLAAGATVRALRKGDRLAREGERSEHLIVVGEGALRAVQTTGDGREIIIETARTGECIAVPSALSSSRHRGDVIASSDTSVVMVPVDEALGALTSDPGFAKGLVVALASEMLGLTDLLRGFSLDVTARLAGRLFQTALASGRPAEGGVRFTLDARKSDLASELGVAPETLSRSFAKLRSAGYIELRGSQVTVLDLKSLAALASGFEV